VQGATISEKTRKRQRFGFWLALALEKPGETR
jgi:hypothetical protein